MTPLSNHTVSLDLSLALREAGWPQEPYFYKWFLVDGKKHVLLNHDEFMRYKDFENSLLGHAVSPLASELLDRMKDQTFIITHDEATNNFVVIGVGLTFLGEDFRGTLPNSLAKLALHLIKTGSMKIV